MDAPTLSPPKDPEELDNPSENHQEQEPLSPQTLTLATANPDDDQAKQEQSDLVKPEVHVEIPNQEGGEAVIDAEKHNEDVLKPDQSEQQPGISLDFSSHQPAPPPSASMILEPISELHVVSFDPPLPSPSNPHRRQNKRKKGKAYTRKLQAIEKKVATLMENLKPVPFAPSKTLDFAKHEKLLRALGLWDFVQIQFDRNVRVDLISQLIATYDQKSRCSYVNEFRIAVNRADMGRALKLPPVKKEKTSTHVLEGIDLDSEPLPEESISFFHDFLSNWVLLHDDTWMMPNEVLDWTRSIKEGRPEKVEWAKLVWFMVEKELNQGDQLKDCYYASHLQYLIKSQREEVLMEAEVEVEAEEVKEEEHGGAAVMEEPNVELTLGGHEIIDKKEENNNESVEMMDVDVDVDESKEDGQKQWSFDGENDSGLPFLQRCESIQEEKKAEFEEGRAEEHQEEPEEGDEEHQEIDEEDEEEEDGDGGFELEPNLIHRMLDSEIPGQSSGAEAHTFSDYPSFFINGGKRPLDHEQEHEHEHGISHTSNKRVRIEEQWDNQRPNFGHCMDQIQNLLTKARMVYEEKEQTFDNATMHQQLLLNELQKRDGVIEHLHKTKIEEIHKRDTEIYRLERELHMMGSLLEGYRKALKETDRAFADYRELYKVNEEPIYRDAGPKGLVMSVGEIERERVKKEEEERLKLLAFEESAKRVEEEFIGVFEGHLGKIGDLGERLLGIEESFKLIREDFAKRVASKEAGVASS